MMKLQYVESQVFFNKAVHQMLFSGNREVFNLTISSNVFVDKNIRQ